MTKKRDKKKGNTKKKSINLSRLLQLLKKCRKLRCCPLKKVGCISIEKVKLNNSIDILGPINVADYTMPKTGDVLVRKPKNYNNLSIINRDTRLSDFLIPEGYYCVVNDLLNRIRKTRSNSDKDSLIYPLLFNFRHYLELIMKDALRNFRIANGEIASNQLGYEKNHSLLSLWNRLKTYIDDPKSSESMAFDKLINELHNIDADSFSFRYSYKGNKDPDAISEPIFNKKIDIDLENIEKVIKKMHCFIEGISDLAYNQRDMSETNNQG